MGALHALAERHLKQGTRIPSRPSPHSREGTWHHPATEEAPRVKSLATRFPTLWLPSAMDLLWRPSIRGPNPIPDTISSRHDLKQVLIGSQHLKMGRFPTKPSFSGF